MAHRVLIVEDDLLLSELLEMLLMVEGMEVDHAAHGVDALDRLAAAHYDLIVLDMMMPVMDGLQFLAELSKSGGQQPPVLVFSASTGPELAQQARQAGAAAVARKPIDQDEFMSLVRSLLGDAISGNSA